MSDLTHCTRHMNIHLSNLGHPESLILNWMMMCFLWPFPWGFWCSSMCQTWDLPLVHPAWVVVQQFWVLVWLASDTKSAHRQAPSPKHLWWEHRGNCSDVLMMAQHPPKWSHAELSAENTHTSPFERYSQASHIVRRENMSLVNFNFQFHPLHHSNVNNILYCTMNSNHAWF